MSKISNTIITASAGTGKTYSLATHFIYLMMVREVAPEQIIAITFTRAAAYEIYQKLVDRLADAAESLGNANQESVNLLLLVNGKIELAQSHEQYDCYLPQLKIEKARIQKFSEADYAALLSKVIQAQHIASIATIDSFILRMVQFFPMELGFQGRIEMLDEQERKTAVDEVVWKLATDEKRFPDFAEAFWKSVFNESKRNVLEAVRDSFQKLRRLILEHPEICGYTADSMMAAIGITEYPAKPAGADLKILGCLRDEKKEELLPFIDTLSKYSGASELKMSGLGGKILERVFAEGRVGTETPYDRGRKTYEATDDEADALTEDVLNALKLYFYRHFQIMEGKIQLARLCNEIYTADVIKAGRLTFEDLPHALADSNRECARLNIEYRFDEQLLHWAIDEFQDTSRDQWKCLQNLVDEAAQGGDNRSVEIVGDVKQAIYAWRGGDARILLRLAEEKGTYNQKELNDSYRYGKNTAALINAVFNPKNIRDAGLDGNAFQGWQVHSVAGAVKDKEDYVCIVPSYKNGNADMTKDCAVHLAADIWKQRKVWAAENAEITKKTIAILVRTNDQGMYIAEELRKKNIPAVFEGESSCADHPVVSAFLSLLHLAEYPGDGYDREIVLRTPLCNIYTRKKEESDQNYAARLSGNVRKDLSHLGLSKTLQTYIRTLNEAAAVTPMELFDSYSKMALNTLVISAIKFEERVRGVFSMDEFIKFVAEEKKRDAANPSVVTVISIHRSKGLGYDWVIVPIPENGAVNKVKEHQLIFHQKSGWLLDDHAKKMLDVAAEKNAGVRKIIEMADKKAFQENLNTYYVALTRNKEALWVVTLPKTKKKDKSVFYFRNVLYSGMEKLVEAPIDETQVIEIGTSPFKKASPVRTENAGPVFPDNTEGFMLQEKKPKLARVTPSKIHGDGMVERSEKAGDIFEEMYRAGAERGTEIHALFEKIDWLPASGGEAADAVEKLRGDIDLSEATAFRKALERPDGVEVIELWREKSFEQVTEEGWISGQFDRVVFTIENGIRCAHIYDYKSNKIRPGENECVFHVRMQETYAPQMRAYISAVSDLTGIPESSIDATLLLLETKSAVTVT